MDIKKIAQVLKSAFKFTTFATDASGNVKGLILPNGSIQYSPIRISSGISSSSLSASSINARILPACAASTTVSQSTTAVTVINGGAGPTAHNIQATTYDGFQVFFPGSPSIAAGWYGGFTRTSTTAYTFNAASATVASESVNSGAAYATETTAMSVTIPGGLLGATGEMLIFGSTGANNTANAKLLKIKFATIIFAQQSLLSGTFQDFSASIKNLTAQIQRRINGGVNANSARSE